MPVYCCVTGCYMRSSRNRGLTFHGFPSEISKREEWIHNISHNKRSVTVHSKICSLHFEESDFLTPRKPNSITRHRFLKEGACPTKNLPTPNLNPKPNLLNVPVLTDPDCSTTELGHFSIKSSSSTNDPNFDVPNQDSQKHKRTSKVPSSVVHSLFSVCRMTENQLYYFTGLYREQLEQLWMLVSAEGRCELFEEQNISCRDQLLLTLIKFHLNFSNETLAVSFDIPEKVAIQIFHDWVNCLYVVIQSTHTVLEEIDTVTVRKNAKKFAIVDDIAAWNSSPLRKKILCIALHFKCLIHPTNYNRSKPHCVLGKILK